MSKLDQTNRQVQDLRNNLQVIITKTQQRGQAIEDIDEKANQLVISAEKFRTQAGKLKMMCRNWKYIGILLLLGGIILVFVLWTDGAFG